VPDAELWDPVYEEAISEVMTASGEYGGFLKSWTTDPASAERFWSRARLSGSPLDHDGVNFVDRNGQWHLSFATATRACQAFAAAEPDLVDLCLRDWEDRLRAEGFEPGNRQSHELLRRWAPAHALARSWCAERQRTAAEQEVERLQRLVREAVRLLEAAGDDRGARRIERGLRGT